MWQIVIFSNGEIHLHCKSDKKKKKKKVPDGKVKGNEELN